MSVESCPGSQQAFGYLQGCLVEGDLEQRARERRIRRRALAISIILQTVALVLVVIVPLFGKTERIAPTFIPIPPYYHSSGPAHPETRPIPPRQRHFTPLCTDCAPRYIPQNVPPPTDDNQPPDVIEGSVPGSGTGPQISGGIAVNDARPQPERPAEMQPRVPWRIVITHIEPAMLIHRVEPIYPPLAIQIRREGHVELHAIIATDGSIQALQAVGGDALFYQSALDAVRQWRYSPTVLNDQPVEIDTFISVIYTMKR